jgi:uncharacterized protein with HEPN domain
LLRDRERVAHIVESVALVACYIRGVDLARLEADVMLQDAVLRRLILIGEAAGKVSPTTSAHYPEVPWRLMADFRNFVVHEYHRVDWLIVWKVVTESLPQSGPALERVLATLSDQG